MTRVFMALALPLLLTEYAFSLPFAEHSQASAKVVYVISGGRAKRDAKVVSPDNLVAATKPHKTTPGGLIPVSDWAAASNAHIGELGGVAVDLDGNPHLFHRADRPLTTTTFDGNNMLKDRIPITRDTVLKLDSQTGEVLDSWGEGKFYMPQGFAIDYHGNFWFTDIGLQQVLKYSPKKELLLAVGEAFTPGNDKDHFCKPTAVAVLMDGAFFVTDGYCNSRVVNFDASGKYLLEFGEEQHLKVPISITILPSHNDVSVFDQGNKRLVGYDAGLTDKWGTKIGDLLRIYDLGKVGTPYAIVYSIPDNLLYGVSVAYNTTTNEFSPVGYTIVPSYNTDIVATWAPEQGFGFPSAIAVSTDGEVIYVGEKFGGKVWKFLRYQTAN